tara:strand:- start:391 stop:1137 length:747 start_codon:yes stop_codon:yes gene_type:complete
MKIKEIENDTNIVISKFQFSCDDEDETIPDPLPKRLNFCFGINGRAGSGKSTLLLNMLCKRKKCYNQKFDKVIVFSPSLNTMDDNPFEDLPEEQMYDDLDEESLQGVIEEITDCGEKVLLVIDDCVNQIKNDMGLQNLLAKVIMNRRHICGHGGGISLFLTSQIYNRMPLPIRKSYTHLILMNCKQKKELDSLYDEHILIDKPDFYKILNYVYKKKHDYLYLDTTKSSEDMFHHNFNKLQLTFPSIED